jgi:hypothetical protein
VAIACSLPADDPTRNPSAHAAGAEPAVEALGVRVGARRIGLVPSRPEGRSLPLLLLEL